MRENAVYAISNVSFRRASSIDPLDPCILAIFETRRVQYRELMQTLRELLPVHSSDVTLTHNITLIYVLAHDHGNFHVCKRNI